MLAEQSGKTKKDTEAFLNTFVDVVSKQVSEGKKIQLIGFGTFELRERKAREGRNPQTGKAIKIPATKVPAFKPGKQFKELCK